MFFLIRRHQIKPFLTKKPLKLTVDNKCVGLALGKVHALAEGLAGELQSILLPGDSVGHVGRGCHPAMAPLRTENAHGGSGREQTASVSNSVVLMKRRKEKATKTSHNAASW